jgi:hypothetical protein
MLFTITVLNDNPSIFQNVELNETIDSKILSQLINSDLLQLVKSDKPGRNIYENEKHHLESILKKSQNNKLKVTYKKSKINFGRVYPIKALSLGSLRKPIRHTLCKGVYIDIDIENCHPQILKQICEHNKIPINYLKQYVDNRAEILKDTQDIYNVSRDDAKLLFIILAYFGSFDTWIKDLNIEHKPPTEFILNYINELKIIGTLIKSANTDISKPIKKCQKENEKASVVSIFLQDKERQILELVYEYLVNNKYIINKNCVLCFDGIMIEEKYYKTDLLNELHDHILKVSGFDLTFCTKNLDKDLLKELSTQSILPLDPKSFEYMSQEFEKTHCKIISQGLYISKENNTLLFFNEKKLRESYKHKSFKNEKGEKENFISHWISNNDNIYAFDDMDIYPNQDKCPTNIFNLWIPFKCEMFFQPFQPNVDALNEILNLIKVLCNNEDKIYQYFIKWIGQMIQYPDVKTICPTLISKMGAGKGTLIHLLKLMLGSNKIMETTNPSRDVWGSFNSAMADSFLVNLNELSKKDTLEAEGQIKGLITDPILTINKKGIDQIQIKSYHRFIITTNKEDPIATSKDDRRNLIIRSSDELCGNKTYFKHIYELLDDEIVVRTCYDYFKSIPDLDKFGLIPIPSTAYQNELKKLDISAPEQFLIHLCELNVDKKNVEFTAKELFEMFQDFLTDSNIKYEITSLKFGVKLANLNISGLSKGRNKKGNTYKLDIQQLQKHFNINEDVFEDEEPQLKPPVKIVKKSKHSLDFEDY